MRPEMLRPIREHLCHCGNVTTGVYRKDPPTEKSKTPCCITCRCDEHGYGTQQTRTGSGYYRESDVMPGCGARCIFHPEDVRQKRINELLGRAMLLNMHTGAK